MRKAGVVILLLGVGITIIGGICYLYCEPKHAELAGRASYSPNARRVPGSSATMPFTIRNQQDREFFGSGTYYGQVAMGIGGVMSWLSLVYLVLVWKSPSRTPDQPQA